MSRKNQQKDVDERRDRGSINSWKGKTTYWNEVALLYSTDYNVHQCAGCLLSGRLCDASFTLHYLLVEKLNIPVLNVDRLSMNNLVHCVTELNTAFYQNYFANMLEGTEVCLNYSVSKIRTFYTCVGHPGLYSCQVCLAYILCILLYIRVWTVITEVFKATWDNETCSCQIASK